MLELLAKLPKGQAYTSMELAEKLDCARESVSKFGRKHRVRVRRYTDGCAKAVWLYFNPKHPPQDAR